MAAEPALEFWFEFGSTYSYIAAMRIEGMCRDAGVQLRWKPFLLGPIFALQGWNDSHFNLNQRRGDYMWRDMKRLTAKFGLPWQRPSRFPRLTTLPARVACAIADELWAGDFIRRTYTANFGEDREIGDREVVTSILTELNRPAEEIIIRAASPAHRGTLRENTEHAIALGIFGAPNCIVENELFWGEETLEDAITWALRRKNVVAASPQILK
ncbi:MAG TPA: 2-hydroxychromene-2-carboxylate isomerase [Candidatus Elarobacter sp.]|jgi:2-hydroxychromene-2-carboxylate isomerase|nr:2-hydroxychromene-2-carboxylate isomerase [Candidatus Elarobacter sp.]